METQQIEALIGQYGWMVVVAFVFLIGRKTIESIIEAITILFSFICIAVLILLATFTILTTIIPMIGIILIVIIIISIALVISLLE